MKMHPEFSLPPLLARLIQSGDWKHPGDQRLLGAIPFLSDPVEFSTTTRQIDYWTDNYSLLSPKEAENFIFREYRGSLLKCERDLPWVDVEKRAFLAVNRIPGDDIAIILDFRSSAVDPRVVASHWTDQGLQWSEVSSSFSEFCILLGLINTEQDAAANP